MQILDGSSQISFTINYCIRRFFRGRFVFAVGKKSAKIKHREFRKKKPNKKRRKGRLLVHITDPIDVK